MQQLKRSNDRKVANLVTPNGKQASIANTFGLPAGKDFSCPNATSVCSKVCYAGKLEKLFPAVRTTLMHNWELLKDADYDTMVSLLTNMVDEFEADCVRRKAEPLFRIHWDGDFFSDTYARAWGHVIEAHPTTRFWVYTRVPSAVRWLDGIDNLSLYFSTDDDNKEKAAYLRKEGIKVRLAYLADTFEDAKQDMLTITGKVGAMCPENAKRIPLISDKGSACFSCGLCIKGNTDIRFSALKK